jgi:acetyl-CoA/propionyl-CoA carboxylase biotin carboxyl carrier protein
VRVDSGVRPDYSIPQHYDSLLAKLVVWAETRPQAIARARRALADYTIGGVITTIPFHQAALAHPGFAAGSPTVNFIPAHPELLDQAAAFASPAPEAAPPPGGEPVEPRTLTVEVNGRRFGVRVFDDRAQAPDEGRAGVANGRRQPPAGRRQAAMAPKVDGVISPIQGRVAAVRAQSGQQVEAGQVLFIVEAMKMENEIAAPHAGTLADVRAQEGATVEAGGVLATYSNA